MDKKILFATLVFMGSTTAFAADDTVDPDAGMGPNTSTEAIKKAEEKPRYFQDDRDDHRKSSAVTPPDTKHDTVNPDAGMGPNTSTEAIKNADQNRR